MTFDPKRPFYADDCGAPSPARVRDRHSACLVEGMGAHKQRQSKRWASHYAPFVAALAMMTAAACTERTSKAPVVIDDLAAASASGPARDGRVVLITIDGARWQDVFEGSDSGFSGAPSIPPEQLMPRAHQLVATRGVALGATLQGCGTAHTAGASNVSLPGYIEIFTGHASQCLDNQCDRVEESVLDEAARAPSGSAASISSWELLLSATSGGGTPVFVSNGRGYPGEPPATDKVLSQAVAAGRNADPYPGYSEYRPDAATIAIALAYYRAEKPALFHIGLGDTDEYGHRGDYASYLDALKRADSLIGTVADLLDTMGPLGAKTTVIVTPDHGRNSDFNNHGVLHPESARTFVLAFGGGVPVRGIACPAHDVTLADIAPTIRVLVGLPRDTADGAGTPIELITARN